MNKGRKEERKEERKEGMIGKKKEKQKERKLKAMFVFVRMNQQF